MEAVMESEPASTGNRIAGYIADYFLFGIVVSVIGAWHSSEFEQVARRLILPIFILTRDVWGRSPGKMLAHLRIIDTAGRDASVSRRILRNVLLAAGAAGGREGLVPFLSLLGIAEVLSAMGSGRRLGDRIAGTKVVALQGAPSWSRFGSAREWALTAVLLIGLGIAAEPIAVREKTAQDQFGRESQVLEEAVRETVDAIRPKINEVFLREASGSPALASLLAQDPALASEPSAFVYIEMYPPRKKSEGYLRENVLERRSVLSTPRSSSEFPKGPIQRDFIQVDVIARSVRPVGLIPQPPRIELLDYAEPQNAIFLEALRKALDEKGMKYSVTIPSMEMRALTPARNAPL
jgi:uncharacterized RDD family membrane protein YckC